MKKTKRVILCVDDDAEFLGSLKAVLEAAGYGVETATGVEEGLEKYRKSNPDLLIVDLMMEEMDSGLVFVRKIRALGSIPPLYLLSAVGSDLSSLADMRGEGVTDILQKPVSSEVLIQLVGTKLGIEQIGGGRQR